MEKRPRTVLKFCPLQLLFYEIFCILNSGMRIFEP